MTLSTTRLYCNGDLLQEHTDGRWTLWTSYATPPIDKEFRDGFAAFDYIVNSDELDPIFKEKALKILGPIPAAVTDKDYIRS